MKIITLQGDLFLAEVYRVTFLLLNSLQDDLFVVKLSTGDLFVMNSLQGDCS